MSVDLVTIGVVTGTTYALLGIGLSLVYRLSGAINLAHGEVGAFGAAVAAVLAVRFGWPFPIALAVGVAAGALVGGLAELVVVKRLGSRPTVVMMVATLGVGRLVALLRVSLPELDLFEPFPRLFDTMVTLGPVELSGPELGAVVLAPTLTALTWWVMARTTTGAVVRATAANPEATRLAGVNAARVSTAVWVAAGALAAVATIAAVPIRGGTAATVATVGPGLLLRGFAAASLGRMRSVPLTLVGGLALGVGEAVIIRWTDDPGATNLVVFLAVLAGLAFLPRDPAIGGGQAAGAARPWSDWPATARVRAARTAPAIAGTVAVVAVPFLVTSAGNTFQLSRLVVMFLVVVSASVLAGWSGQLSLAQFALAGIGALVSARLVGEGVSWEMSLVAGTVVAALAAALVALPTSRLRGALLGIATLGLAVMAPAWLFRQGFTGDRQVFVVPRMDFGLFELRPQRSYYFFVVAIAMVVALVASALGSRSSGRRWRAVKDNERGAAAFGISPWRSRVGAFVACGAIAGLAGGLLGGLMVSFERGVFDPTGSLDAIVMAVVGGPGSVAGAALGVLWVDGIASFFPDLESLQLLVSGVGLLALLVYAPDGLAGVVRRGQELLAGPRLARGPAEPPAMTPAGTTPAGTTTVQGPGALPGTAAAPATVTGEGAATRAAVTVRATAGPGGNGRERPPLDRALEELGRSAGERSPGAGAGERPDLRVDHVSVRFGGRAAVDDVSFAVDAGAVVGLIGPNGAGKTTLLNAVSGLQRSTGTLAVGGVDMTGWSADRRARHGVSRTFQDALLFPTMTVRDTVRTAAATGERASVVLDALVPGPARRAERRIAERADGVIGLTGLGRYADERCAVLSTGARRVVEVACLVAAGGRLLLLDEPTAGLAQREVEAFPPILRALRDHLDATVVIVEHDIVMLASVCDRLVCMEAGRVIADGPPDAVRHDPAVIESYLGPDVVAVERTGAAPIAAES